MFKPLNQDMVDKSNHIRQQFLSRSKSKEKDSSQKKNHRMSRSLEKIRFILKDNSTAKKSQEGRFEYQNPFDKQEFNHFKPIQKMIADDIVSPSKSTPGDTAKKLVERLPIAPLDLEKIDEVVPHSSELSSVFQNDTQEEA